LHGSGQTYDAERLSFNTNQPDFLSGDFTVDPAFFSLSDS
jgi:hypothetical protein